MNNEKDPWAGLLDADEKILWQGAPEYRVRIEWDSPLHPFFFLFFTGFSIFWMVMASSAPGPFWMFGLLFFGVGFYNLVLVHFWKAYVRKNTHYTLTNKRAFLAMTLPFKGRSLESYPIRPETPLNLIEGTLSTIHFASKTSNVNNNTTETPIGFEDIANGREVYQKLRQIQQAVQ